MILNMLPKDSKILNTDANILAVNLKNKNISKL